LQQQESEEDISDDSETDSSDYEVWIITNFALNITQIHFLPLSIIKLPLLRIEFYPYNIYTKTQGESVPV
jgi:hypothetical protein